MLIHLKMYCAILALLGVLFACAVIDSSARRAPETYSKPLQHVAPLLPSMDAVLDNSARYIRHLSLATPASAFSDFPAQADYLPAGIAWAPPAFVGFAQPSVMAPVDPCPDKQP
jgi:hypothetical protein